MKYYLAIDIGASSGRAIVGWQEDGILKTDEVYRFPNGVSEEDGHLVWKIEQLLENVKEAVGKALEKYEIESMSIDSWGVDYVLLNGDSEIMPVYAYRDHRMDEVIDEVHSKVDFTTLYNHTGCQFQPFNTIYQLYSDKKMNRLEKATDFLMIPEYLMYKLTGIKVKEFTNATTTGLINNDSLDFDSEIIEKLGLPAHLFRKLHQPGEFIGCLSEEVQKQVNGNCRVVLCATHDTGSAVEGIQMEGRQLYISSGTWSLLGVKTDKPITDEGSMKANYSNEGGVGYNRYQKNIMGMWLVNELQRELCPEMSISDIVRKAEESNFNEIIDANDSSLLSPESMKKAFDRLLGKQLDNTADYFRCAYLSLAESYRISIQQLENNTGIRYDRLYIVGGGAKNQFLNRLTAQSSGKEVIALPIEATAIGNLTVQMKQAEQ